MMSPNNVASVRQLLPNTPIFVSSPSGHVPTPPHLLQHLSTLQPTPPSSMTSSMTSRVLTLERREEKSLIESALDNTEKIVANLLAGKKQVVLKERTPCYVVLWYETVQSWFWPLVKNTVDTIRHYKNKFLPEQLWNANSLTVAVCYEDYRKINFGQN